MTQRQKQRAAGIDVGELTTAPSEGLIALHGLTMQREKLERELKSMDKRSRASLPGLCSN